MRALRTAVHALHDESERHDARPWAAAWSGTAPLQSAVARLELAPDDGEPSADRFVALLAQCRLATTRYVVELRAEGESPEHMLVRVKGALRDALTDESWFDRSATRSLTSAVVIWSIDAYYGS